jgi:hypothetical protein
MEESKKRLYCKFDSEANRVANDLFRRWKLGTINQKKLKDIFEDQMFFSTRFLENIKSLLKEKI